MNGSEALRLSNVIKVSEARRRRELIEKIIDKSSDLNEDDYDSLDLLSLDELKSINV